jgi:hypothetical protein
MSRRKRPTLLSLPPPSEGQKGGARRREWGCRHIEELVSVGAGGTKNAGRNEGDALGGERERESE